MYKAIFVYLYMYVYINICKSNTHIHLNLGQGRGFEYERRDGRKLASLHVYRRMCICRRMSTHACMDVRTYYVCMPVWMDGWMDVCIHVYIHIYTHLHIRIMQRSPSITSHTHTISPSHGYRGAHIQILCQGGRGLYEL